MGLLSFITQWRTSSRIKSLESQIQVRPTPQLYLQLADAHKETGNSQKAAQVLKLAAARFPSAPEILRRQAEVEDDRLGVAEMQVAVGLGRESGDDAAAVFA